MFCFISQSIPLLSRQSIFLVYMFNVALILFQNLSVHTNIYNFLCELNESFSCQDTFQTLRVIKIIKNFNTHKPQPCIACHDCESTSTHSHFIRLKLQIDYIIQIFIVFLSGLKLPYLPQKMYETNLVEVNKVVRSEQKFRYSKERPDTSPKNSHW